MEKNEIILGLDVSTKTIGMCLFLNDGTEYGKILKLTYISPTIPQKIKGIESLLLKNNIFRKEIISQYKNYGITRVIIEAPLLRSQNIGTVATLLQFNGIICNTVYEELNIIPELISSYDARMYAFPSLMSIRKFNKKGEKYDISHYKTAIRKNQLVEFGSFPFDIDKKEILQGKISEIYTDIEWSFDKYEILKVENFDAVDSLVAILGKLNMDRYKDEEFKIISSDFTKKNEITYQVKFGNKTIDKKIEL